MSAKKHLLEQMGYWGLFGKGGGDAAVVGRLFALQRKAQTWESVSQAKGTDGEEGF